MDVPDDMATGVLDRDSLPLWNADATYDFRLYASFLISHLWEREPAISLQ